MTASKCFFTLIALATLLTTSSQVSAQMPGADTSQVWTYITQTAPYSDWGFWDDHKGLQKGDQPHGSFNKVYVNDIARNSRGSILDYGAIQVKENYTADKTLAAITVMYKVKGFNPDAGDWFWVKFSPDGKAKTAGKPKGCISCHGGRADNDYVMVHDLN